MGSWPVQNSETRFKCSWFSVGYDDVEVPDGGTDRYYWIDRPNDGIGIVAIDGDDIIMVEQYRPKLGQMFLECPGGQVEAGESFEEAAARELQEETGFIADTVTHLTTYYPSATTKYERGVVVAEGLTAGDPELDDTEYLSWKRVPTDDALTGATERPTTGWTLTPLLLAAQNGYLE